MGREKEIVVIVLSYNNRLFVAKNICSILGQSYKNFSIVYVDDCSDDGTYELASQMLVDVRAKLVRNGLRLGAMENLYRVVHSLAPDQIVVIVDGDDWLSDKGVLTYINEIYCSRDVWLTYGSYLKYPFCEKGSVREADLGVIREGPFLFKHLRTFVAGLFQKIQKEDFMMNGQFVPVASDMAAMFPMVEMAHERSLFIDEILYIYNYTNPLSDGCIHQEEMKQVTEYLRRKAPYQRIDKLR